VMSTEREVLDRPDCAKPLARFLRRRLYPDLDGPRLEAPSRYSVTVIVAFMPPP